MKLVGSEWEEGAEEMNAFVFPLVPKQIEICFALF